MQKIRKIRNGHVRTSVLILILLICLLTGLPLLPCSAAWAEEQKPQVLFINSYGYDFETVRIVTDELERALNDRVSLHYIFMNEKYVNDETASQSLCGELDELTQKFRYDAVILGDDAAFDFAIRYRDIYFEGIPLVFENINGEEKATQYALDPLICGVVEKFPFHETLMLAKKLTPNARRVVIITDNSVSAQGTTHQILREETNFPELTFEIFDCSVRTAEEIRRDISVYGRDTILLYTVFNVDGEQYRYSLAEGVKLISDAAQIPVFKADEAGVGDGLLGGYVLSYESVGQKTAEILLNVLDGMPGQGYSMGNCRYQFDAAVMERFGIGKSDLPPDAVFLNDVPGFFERYWKLLIPFAAIAVVLILIIIINKIHEIRMQSRLIEELRTRQETYRAVIENSDRILFRYSIAEKTVYLPDRMCEVFHLPKIIRNIPESMLEGGRIAAESEEEYRMLYQTIDSGISCRRDWMIDRISVSGEKRCMKTRYVLIGGVEGKPDSAIIYMDDVTESRQRETLLEQKAARDGLTGIFNRETAERSITEMLSEGRAGSCALMVLDLDDFKNVNDTLGHGEGDRALRAVAEVLHDHFRNTDIIGRLGGDEFIAFLPGNVSEENMSRSLNRLQRAFSDIRIGVEDSHAVSCSIGVALGVMNRDTFPQLYKNADAALYRVKRSSKGGFAFYFPEMESADRQDG